MTKIIPYKQLMDAVEKIITDSSKEELGEILKEMARQIPKERRQYFLDQLHPYTRKEEPQAEKSIDGSLLNEVDEFIETLTMEMENREESDYEYDDDFYDEEDGEFYADFIMELENLFDQTDTAFDYKQFAIAKKAYEKLLQVLTLEDGFGSGIRQYDLGNISLGNSLTRYYRAVLETEPTKDKAKVLFTKLQKYNEYEKGIPLKNIMSIISGEIYKNDTFLTEWIDMLKKEESPISDYYLREAVLLRDGIDGIKSLALSEGKKRPRAFLDWIKELMKIKDYESIFDVRKEVAGALDKELPIFSAISDLVKVAAERVGDEALIEKSIWDAFFAKPDQDHLLTLWEYYKDKDDYLNLMVKAAQRIKNYLESKNSIFSIDSVERDHAEQYARPSKFLLVHSYLFSKEWEKVLTIAKQEKEYGWSYSDNPQGLILSGFLAIMIGQPIDKLPPNLKHLFENMLGDRYDFFHNKEEDSKLKKIYSEYLPTISLGDKEKEIIQWCIDICKRRVNYIVDNKNRKSYGKAATLIAACAEVLKKKGKNEDAVNLISYAKNEFPRHRAFQGELSSALSRLR
ncbi:MAG: hypothetical protein ACMUIP_00675 [bacterium]